MRGSSGPISSRMSTNCWRASSSSLTRRSSPSSWRRSRRSGGAQPGGGGDLARAVGLRDPLEQRQRLVEVALLDEQLGEGDDGVLVARLELERLAQARFVAGRRSASATRSRPRSAAGCRRTAAPRARARRRRSRRRSGRRASRRRPGSTGPGRPGRCRVLVDVDLDQHDLAVGGVDRPSRGSDRASGTGRTRAPTGRRRRGPADFWMTSVWNVASVTSTRHAVTLPVPAERVLPGHHGRRAADPATRPGAIPDGGGRDRAAAAGTADGLRRRRHLDDGDVVAVGVARA